MRLATACVICAGALEPGVRADCRYCGVRCRMRAYRVRLDSGGCLRSDAQRKQVRTLRQRLQRDRESLNAERADFRQQQAEAAQRAAEQAEREKTDRAAAATQKQAADAAAVVTTQKLAAQAERITVLEQQAQQRAIGYTALKTELYLARENAEKQRAHIQQLQRENARCYEQIERLVYERDQLRLVARGRAPAITARQQAPHIVRSAGNGPPTGRMGPHGLTEQMPEDWRRRIASLESLTQAQAHTLGEREQEIEALTTKLATLRQESEQELATLHSSKRKAEQQAAEQIAKLTGALDEAQQEIVKLINEIGEAKQQLAKWRDPVFRELRSALLKDAALGTGGLALMMLRTHLGIPEVLDEPATAQPSRSGSAVPQTAPSRQPPNAPPTASADSAGVVPPSSSMPPQPSPPAAAHSGYGRPRRSEGPVQRMYRAAEEQARREQERQSRLKKP